MNLLFSVASESETTTGLLVYMEGRWFPTRENSDLQSPEIIDEQVRHFSIAI